MFLRKRRKSIEEEVLARLGAARVQAFDKSANCFGVESAGKGQWRGNGCLAASDEIVLFIMWLPRKEVLIPRSRITSVERARSHLGKRIWRDLLLVRFTNDNGGTDSVAWYVADLSLWEKVLGT